MKQDRKNKVDVEKLPRPASECPSSLCLQRVDEHCHVTESFDDDDPSRF